MDLEEAAHRFLRSTYHCDNLIETHTRAGGTSRGRRSVEPSLNRAVIVMALGSWQAVVQDLTDCLLDATTPPSDPAQQGLYRLLHGNVQKQKNDFSTPNAENSRNLLKSAGCDPRPYWTWRSRDGRAGAVELAPTDVENRLREWLKVRHAVAHGDALLPAVDALQAVRQGAFDPAKGPSVRLIDAKGCLHFVRKLAQATSDGVADTIGVPRRWLRDY